MRQFVIFGFVGALGSVSNLVCFYGFQILGLQYMLNACLCFGIAVSQNYMLNTRITFAHHLSWRAYGLYVGANLFGLGVNLIVLWLCKRFLLPVAESSLANLDQDTLMLSFQAFAIICAMASNFCLAKYIIFRERTHAANPTIKDL